MVGFKQITKHLFTYRHNCRSCRRTTAHAVSQTVTWLTFFFIPVLPIRTRRWTQCTYCGVLEQLNGQQADNLRSGLDPSEAHADATRREHRVMSGW
jgi:hypothetical protein